VDTGVQIAVRVRPGSSRDRVGGCYGPDILVVAVTARAVDGAANRAVIAALARAFAARKGDVAIVSGTSSRTKIVSIAGDRSGLERRYAELLGM
jgi:uncharacterized protein